MKVYNAGDDFAILKQLDKELTKALQDTEFSLQIE
jgi:hypothetical protein